MNGEWVMLYALSGEHQHRQQVLLVEEVHSESRRMRKYEYQDYV
jgi:hypothetical protein